MGAQELKSALQNSNKVDLTVTGRKSGHESSRPVWFVGEGDKILLLPVGGSGASWFKNIQKTPTIGLAGNGADFHGEAEPTEDPSAVSHAIEAFGGKYGADKVKEYYPEQDAAVEVPLA